MIRKLILFSIGLLVTVSAVAAPADFTVTSPIDGKTFRLSDAKGRYVALHFLLKTECPFCLRHTAEYTIKAKGPTLETIMQKGFVYVLMVPMKSPGVYQYRVAVRDKASGKIGSAGQIIQVPDLTKRKLTLSNLFAENVSMSVWQSIAAGKVGEGPGQVKVPSTLVYDTVLRKSVAGSVLRYGIEVYNAKSDGGMPNLETQAQILQNNSVVIEGNLNKVNASAQADPKHVRVSGAIMLKDNLQPGDYLLRLTVFDRGGRQTATQVFPFEIVK